MTEAASLAPPRAAPARARPVRLTASRYTTSVLVICLVLQRFALPAGAGLAISVATPLVLLLSAWGLAGGVLVLDRWRTALFFGLVGAALLGVAVHVSIPIAIAPRMSLTSLYYWLLITGYATLRFRERMDEAAFFRIVSRVLTAIAVAGIVQFVVQFVGLTLFEFSGLVPDRLLIEDQYAVAIPIEGTALFRSNGFFLIEPSVFSQFMAVGIVVEALYFRRLLRIALCFAGLLVSISGTGWMVLGAFVIALALSSGPRGLASAAVFVLGIALALGLASFIVPDVTSDLLGRVGEFSLPGSSGNERFVTPFMALGAVLAAAPWTFFTGIGPGGSEQLLVPFFYRLNTPVKIQMDYGIIGLLFYLALLISGSRPRRQWLLLAPLLTLLLITGGYHQFSPVLFPVLLLGTVGFLRPERLAAPVAHGG